MSALTWTRAHLPHVPHRHAPVQAAAVAAPHRLTFRMVAAAFLAGYVALLGVFVLVAWGVFGMTALEALAWGLGVATYILAFSAFIAGLVWVATNNILEHPSRRGF
jgi:VIT1/CCC1 family predicted Fe2+/Mn2+ transporter